MNKWQVADMEYLHLKWLFWKSEVYNKYTKIWKVLRQQQFNTENSSTGQWDDRIELSIILYYLMNWICRNIL